MTLGQRILSRRTALGLSQSDLADRLEVSRQSVSKWETDASVPDLDKLVKLADLFGLSLDELVRGEEEAPDPDPAPEESPAPQPPVREVRVEVHRTPSRLLVGLALVLFGLLGGLLLTLAGLGVIGLALGLVLAVVGLVVMLPPAPRLAAIWVVWGLIYHGGRWATGIGIGWAFSRSLFQLARAGEYPYTVYFIVGWAVTLITLLLAAVTARMVWKWWRRRRVD